MGLCNKSETISNILKLRTISKPKKDQAQGGLFGHHPKRSKKNEDVCLRNGLLVTCLRMFWVRKFKTHFVRVWQETYWYRIQMNPAGSARVEFFTLHLSPNSFSYPQPVLPRIGSVISLDLSPSLALIHLNGRQRIALFRRLTKHHDVWITHRCGAVEAECLRGSEMELGMWFWVRSTPSLARSSLEKLWRSWRFWTDPASSSTYLGDLMCNNGGLQKNNWHGDIKLKNPQAWLHEQCPTWNLTRWETTFNWYRALSLILPS